MSEPFSIGVDIRVLATGRQSGVEQYVLGLLPAMIEAAPHLKFKLFFNAWEDVPLDYPWIKNPNVELFRFHFHNRLLLASGRLLDWPKIDQLLRGVDVFFSPHFLLAPLSSSSRLVTTFHDLSFIRYPRFFSWRKNLWHRLEMTPLRQAQLSSKVIAVSYSTRNDLISLFGVKPDKIKVIYSGINRRFKEKILADSQEIARVRTRYQLPERFFLFLATLEPRKNILGILRAFEIFCARSTSQNNEDHLVLAGEKGWQGEEVFKFWRRSACQKKIHFAGRVEEDDKPLIYSLARVFVYPSFFEGFGFPPLEAMAAGVPVITSFNSSLAETAGGAAVLVDPYRTEQLVEAMERLWKDDYWRDYYIEKGQARARLFSWEKAARETLAVLTSVDD